MVQDGEPPLAKKVPCFLFVSEAYHRHARAVRRSAQDFPDGGAGFGRDGVRMRVALFRPLLRARTVVGVMVRAKNLLDRL